LAVNTASNTFEVYLTHGYSRAMSRSL